MNGPIPGWPRTFYRPPCQQHAILLTGIKHAEKNI